MNEIAIQFEDGPVEDSFLRWGLIYLGADKRFAPDEKAGAVSSYIDAPGEFPDGRVADAPFDYSVNFIVEAPGRDLQNVNSRIRAFNQQLSSPSDIDGVRNKRLVSVFNYADRVRIVGFAQPIAVPESVFHSRSHGTLDFAEVSLKIRAFNPALCDFDLFLGDGANLLRNSFFSGFGSWLTNLDVAIDPARIRLGRNSVSIRNPEGRQWASVAQDVSLAPGDYTLAARLMTGIPDGGFLRVEVRGMESSVSRLWTKVLARFDDTSLNGQWQSFVGNFSISEADLSKTSFIQIAFTMGGPGIAWVNSPVLASGSFDSLPWSASPLDDIIEPFNGVNLFSPDPDE